MLVFAIVILILILILFFSCSGLRCFVGAGRQMFLPRRKCGVLTNAATIVLAIVLEGGETVRSCKCGTYVDAGLE